jgi:NADH-quinone oxidoreductase subunit H
MTCSIAALLQGVGSDPGELPKPGWSPVELLVELGIQRPYAETLVWPAIQMALIFFVILTIVAYLVYMERKVSAFIQSRLGPMRVGPVGLLQPLADGIKLLAKEDVVPDAADRLVFLAAPIIAVVCALALMALVPFGAGFGSVTDVNIAVLLILSVSSVGVLGIVLAGWSSNSKYALLGGVRSTAQMISYEVAVALALIGPLMYARSLSLGEIIDAQRLMGIPFVLLQPLAFGIYIVGSLAETNRAPFDLPEAESEIVAGYHVEYSGFRWALFFMAEYAAMIVTSAVAVAVFLGGWWFPGMERLVDTVAGWVGSSEESSMTWSLLYTSLSVVVFSAKLFGLLYITMWVRWTLPRYRYDQLMDLGWKWMIPAGLVNIVLTAIVYVVALPKAQGGLFGFIESTKRGLVVGNWVGYGYFFAAALVSIGVMWLALAWINRRTSDFNLHAQRQLQIQRRAERLAGTGGNES